MTPNPNKKLWHIDGQDVKRAGETVAVISTHENGSLRWDSELLGMYRFGFKDSPEGRARILEDVKYFHRYRPPRLKVTYKSGRTVVYP